MEEVVTLTKDEFERMRFLESELRCAKEEIGVVLKDYMPETLPNRPTIPWVERVLRGISKLKSNTVRQCLEAQE